MRSEGFTLKTLDHRGSHDAGQVPVFAKTLGDTAPPRIASHIDHGCECPVDALRCGLECRNARTLADEIGVERCRETQRDRENGAVAMYDVSRHQ